MNIVIVSHLYFPNIGGVEIAVSKLAAYLVKNGNLVHILTSRFPQSLSKREFLNKIVILRLPFRIPEMTSVSAIIKFPIRLLECLLEISAFCVKNKTHIVNLHYPSENALYAVLLSKLSHAPLITSIHGSDIESFAQSGRLKKWIVGFALNNSSFIVANSQDLSNKAKSLYGKIDDSKFRVIGNCVEIPEHASKSSAKLNGDKYILGVGRFVIVKGFDILIQAFKIFSQKTPNVRLIILGDGEEKENLLNLVNSLALQDLVTFPGNIENSKVFDYLSGCEFLVLPSRPEAFGIVCLEAMAVGKPVIAFNVGGVSEVVKNGYNGLLVDEHNPDSLAGKMIDLFGNKELAEMLGKNGEEFVRSNYSPEVVLGEYSKTFENLILSNEPVYEN